MIIDFHIHSRFSADSLSRPRNILRTAKRKGLGGVAITDHDTIAGAREVLRLNDDPEFMVIVGCEVHTEAGDIIGLFLEHELHARNSLELIEEIHAQGGLTVLPHPYKWHKLHDRLLEQIDIIEIFNGRTDVRANQRAYELAQRLGKPMIVGSDAHFLCEIGNCTVAFPHSDIRQALLNQQGQFRTSHSRPHLALASVSAIIKTVRLGEYARLPRRIAALAWHSTPLGRRYRSRRSE